MPGYDCPRCMLRSEVYLSAVDGRDKSCWKDHEHMSRSLVAAIEQKGATADHGSGSTSKAILNVVED